jgi:signal transduction histidine kinase
MPDIDWRTPGLESILVEAINNGRAVNDTLVRAESRIGSELTLNMNVRRLNSQPGTASPGYLLVAFEDITRRRRAEDERELLLTELQESQTRLEVRVQERTQELGKSYAQLRDLGEQLVLAHESEQRRIARELHDQIGQDLTALKIMLTRGKSGGPEDAMRTLQEAVALTEELLQTVRNICGTLRPQVLDDLGLVHGLEWHIKTFSVRTGMDISVDLQPLDEGRLSPIVKSTIFRVIQEALTNVSRHAETKTAAVTLRATDGIVEFSVRDNGKGLDAEEVAKKSSTGISGMRERLSLVQGRFEISSAPGEGTTIRAQIPLLPPSKILDTQRTTPTQERNRIHHGKITSNQSNHR